MRIAIVAPSPRPFVFGGAERLWLDLATVLNRLTPHEVDLIKMASPEGDLQQVVESYRRFHEMDLGDFDAVVVTKYPAWMVRHPHKVVYMQHKLRGLYDTYPTRLSLDWRPLLSGSSDRALAQLLDRAKPDGATAQRLDDSFAMELLQAVEEALGRWPAGDPRRAFPGPVARAVVHALDGWALAPARVRRYAAISRTVARRTGYFPPGVEVHVAHHPSGLALSARQAEKADAGDAVRDRKVRFLAVSRLDRAKRLDWVIRAFAKVGGHTALTIVGDGPQAEELRTLAAKVPGVTMAGRLSDEELARSYATHDVAVFVPYDEDMGLVTLEAMGSECPVITTRDSGGVCELVEHGVTGWLVEPDIDALAEAMRQAAATGLEQLREMGSAAQKHAQKVDWQGVVGALGLGQPDAKSSREGNRGGRQHPRPRVVVLAPHGLGEPRGGGANRIFHLYRELARLGWSVVVLCLAQPAGTWQVEKDMTVVNVPAEPDWHAAARLWREGLGVPADDVAMLAHPELLTAYRETAASWLRDAQVAVLSHPWALHLLPQPWTVPLVYDAHNVETCMKAAMWSTRGRVEMVERAVVLTREAEQMLIRRAALVAAVSAEDAQALRELVGMPEGQGRVIEVPNGVEPWPLRLPDGSLRLRVRARLWPSEVNKPQDAALALFIGARHAPNEEGLVRLAEGWHGERGRVRVAIAGSVCQANEVKAAASAAGWRLLGRVDDVMLRQWLIAADFGLNPMLSGGGTNLKVLQYAMAGATVVSTVHGLRGFPPQRPRPWASLCGVEDFQAELEKLLDHDAIRERLRREARTVALRFTWSTCASRLAEALEGLGLQRVDETGTVVHE